MTGTPFWLTNSLLVCRPVFLPDQSEAVWVLPLPLGSRPVVAGAILGLACSAMLPPLGGVETLISGFVLGGSGGS